jgi:hypothetical protein
VNFGSLTLLAPGSASFPEGCATTGATYLHLDYTAKQRGIFAEVGNLYLWSMALLLYLRYRSAVVLGRLTMREKRELRRFLRKETL